MHPRTTGELCLMLLISSGLLMLIFLLVVYANLAHHEPWQYKVIRRQKWEWNDQVSPGTSEHKYEKLLGSHIPPNVWPLRLVELLHGGNIGSPLHVKVLDVPLQELSKTNTATSIHIDLFPEVLQPGGR